MLLAKAFPEIYWKIHWINSELRILPIFYEQLHFEEELIGAGLSVWNNECSEPLPLLCPVANYSQAGKISHWRKKTMEIGRYSRQIEIYPSDVQHLKKIFDKKTRLDHLVSFRRFMWVLQYMIRPDTLLQSDELWTQRESIIAIYLRNFSTKAFNWGAEKNYLLVVEV